MSRIFLADPGSSDAKMKSILGKFAGKVKLFPPGTCPLTVMLSLLNASKNQTCSKCVPCRDGIPKLEEMLSDIISGRGTMEKLNEMRDLAVMIRDTADCAIGYETASELLSSMDIFADEYENHILRGGCAEDRGQKVPCVNLCPAHVNIPAYIALIREGDYAGAVNMIRKDNPLPTACAFVCEHPCEEQCRRMLIDAPLNIRGLKRYAVDHAAADTVKVPEAGVPTGKRVAVIGGGPAGLTAAFFLAQMGHKVIIYERHEKLGGMLRYGIPAYRFPKDRLDEDIRAILSAGDIEVRCGVMIGTGEGEISPEEIRNSCDAMFVAVGAQAGKRLHLDGIEGAKNVESAVEMLDRAGRGDIPDYTGKNVVIIGGGNVAMDAARTALRCGAEHVCSAYRRRRVDMTAQDDEVEAAATEGVEILTLMAPKAVRTDADGNCTALVVQPQMIGPYDRKGRPAPVDAPSKEPVEIPCQVLLLAIGQDVVTAPFESVGITAERGAMKAGLDTAAGAPGVFAGGDCATGPTTVIRAVAAGKTAAHNIDEYLGYHHKISCGAEVPAPAENNRIPTGRANMTMRPAHIRKCDFELVENEYTFEEAMQEANRCLRCDHFGCGVLTGGMD